MAERTLRRNKGRNSGAVSGASNDAATVDGDSVIVDEPDTGQSDEPIQSATIDDYIVDEPVNGTDNTFVDPATGSSSSDGSRTRKQRSDRGTRRGRRKSRADATETTRSVANVLFAAHLGIATMLKSNVFAISKEESEAYAQAVTNVTQLYDLPEIGEKALAWTNLAMVMGGIYIPRAVAYKMSKQPAKETTINATFVSGHHSPHPNPPRQPINIQDAVKEAAL